MIVPRGLSRAGTLNVIQQHKWNTVRFVVWCCEMPAHWTTHLITALSHTYRPTKKGTHWTRKTSSKSAVLYLPQLAADRTAQSQANLTVGHRSVIAAPKLNHSPSAESVAYACLTTLIPCVLQCTLVSKCRTLLRYYFQLTDWLNK